MSEVPGAELAYDDEGHLYEPRLRDLLGGSVAAEQLVAVEAIMALDRAARLLDRFMRGVRNRYGPGSEPLKVLTRLHEHRAGLPLDEMVADLNGSPTILTGRRSRRRLVTC